MPESYAPWAGRHNRTSIDPMRLLSRHILRTLAAPFAWSLLALTGLLLLNQLAPLIDRFGGKGLDLRVMGEAMVLAIPALMVLTLPMAVLTATLYAYSQLAGDLEMVAMYANGVSVWKMVRPAMVGAGFVAIVNFVMFDQLVPLSNARYSQLRRSVAQKTPTLAFKPQILNAIPPIDTRYYLRAVDIDPASGRMRDVLIYDLTASNARRVIRADSGVMTQSPDQIDLLLTLFNGEIRDYKAEEPGRVEQTAFVRDRIRIRDVSNQLDRGQGISREERSMSSCQLLDEVERARWQLADGNRTRAEYTRDDLRQLSGLPPVPRSAVRLPPDPVESCGRYRDLEKWINRLVLPAEVQAQDPVKQSQDTVRPRPKQQLRESLGARKQRSIELDSFARAQRRADSLAQAQAESTLVTGTTQGIVPPFFDSTRFLVQPPAPAQLPSNGLVSTTIDVGGARAQAEFALSIVRTHSVEYHKKFALPLASFCFVLVGMALALKYPRSGIGLVIGGSLVIFMVFYVLLIGGKGLADKGLVHPIVAMHGPVALLTVIGLAAVAAANREMGTARSGGNVDALRSLFGRGDDA